MKKIFHLLVLFLIVWTAACSSIHIDENDPASLYKEAQGDIESDHYQIAIDKLRAIKNKFPYSSYASECQLRIADVYYMQDLFAEAAVNYQIFKDLHPKHPKVPYAMFRVAKSYYKDAPTLIDRDLTPLKKSQDAYNEFIARFPSAPEAIEARKDIAEIKSKLAAKELLIGEFYIRRNLFESAKPRLEKVAANFPDTEEAKLALKKLDYVNQRLTTKQGNSK